ncbi:hypothetical protein glysoja_008791 [Glycine soja]|nr:hypothetical protein glysoja_008791 [Glycine soja]
MAGSGSIATNKEVARFERSCFCWHSRRLGKRSPYGT